MPEIEKQKQNLIITSKDNQYIKLAGSLQQKKYRIKNGLFLIEGIRNAAEAIKSNVEISFALIDAAKIEQAQIVNLLGGLKAKTLKIFGVESKIFQALADTEASQGVILLGKIPNQTEAYFFAATKGKHLAVLDGLQDPGNVGTILRTAWAAGLGGVILVNNAVELYSPKVVRATMGAIYNLPTIALANKNAWDFLYSQGYQTVGADLQGVSYRKFKPAIEQPLAWVLGSEGAGLSDFWQEKCQHRVYIPMACSVESLNVAVAAGVLFFAQGIIE